MSFSDKTKLPLSRLAWPILIENLIRVSMTSVDVFMLSYFSSDAVAATGLANQLVFFILLLYTMVAAGASILISQYLGARDTVTAGRVAQGSIVLSIIFAVCISVPMCLNLNGVLNFFMLEPQVRVFALEYLFIYMIGSVSVALCIALSTIIRSYGHSRGPMFISVGSVFLNVIGNYIFIFGAFGAPVLGVKGVALATVGSNIIACVLLYIMMKMHRDIVLERGGLFKVPRLIYKQILAVGVPTAGENVSYNIGQIIIMRMISSLGTDAINAFVYAITILRFVFITSVSIGSAVQIKVGYFVGAGMANIAQKKVYGYFALGVVISLVLAIVTKIFQAPLMDIFKANYNICTMAFGVFSIGLLHEPGRNFNVIIIPALKGAGDVRFPVYIGMIFMWGVGVVLAYVFGIMLGWGLMGICLALAIDEWTRGTVMFVRWHRGRWKTKVLINREASVALNPTSGVLHPPTD